MVKYNQNKKLNNSTTNRKSRDSIRSQFKRKRPTKTVLKSGDLPSKEPKKVRSVVRTTSRNKFTINQKREAMAKPISKNCEYCDNPIPKARLEALPDAVYCIKCATKIQAQNQHDYIPSRDIIEAIEPDDITDD